MRALALSLLGAPSLPLCLFLARMQEHPCVPTHDCGFGFQIPGLGFWIVGSGFGV